MKIIGFTFLRNAVRYDYPYQESLQSLAPLCQEIHLALGKSEDGTETKIAQLSLASPLKITPTIWDESNRQGGQILSEQTNIALDSLRKAHSSGWAFYLQGDEVLLEKEYQTILQDLARAEAEGCDAVRFRYLHFWLSPHKIAISKHCYPQEIRAIRIESNLRSYGDAQSFRPTTKIFESDAQIFHYGHVRKPDAYEQKKRDFHRWWHNDAEIKKVIAKGEKVDADQICVDYLGAHPSVMTARLGLPPAEKKPEVVLFGNPQKYRDEFVKSIGATAVTWIQDKKKLRTINPETCILLDDFSWLDHLKTGFRFRSQVPKKMLSPEARPWPNEFLAVLRLSEKGVSTL